MIAFIFGVLVGGAVVCFAFYVKHKYAAKAAAVEAALKK